MNSLTVILLVIIVTIVFGDNKNPGHLKPFGSVGSLIDIKEQHGEYPTASKLFTHYIAKSEPCIFRQVLVNDKHYSVWQTDKQLEDEVYGLSETKVQVDSFRSRERQKIEITFGEFLQRYKKEPLLFANNVPSILQKYLTVPNPLQCEAVLEIFQSAILVINGVNASPLLFAEDSDHFHCILRGTKRLVLVNTLQYPEVRKIVVPEKRNQILPHVNPDRVDLDQFPALANIDYHMANLTSGDCLFVPNGWIFQERAFENTMSVIYNIKHRQALNIDVNELKTCPEYDGTFTLDQIDWSSERQPQSFKDLIMNMVNSNVDGFDKWQETFSKHFSYDLSSDPEASAIFEEFYGIIDMDGNGQVTQVEVEQINGAHQHHITDILYEIAKTVNNKRKTSTPKPASFGDDQSTQTIENNNEIDENLHLQNYKTDL